MQATKKNDQLINVLSAVIPVAVAVLIGVKIKIDLGQWTKVLPHVIGLLNSTTSLSLVIGLIGVKSGNISLHRKAMGAAFVQGSVFLVLYILYHISNPSTPFGGEGWIRPVYYFLLISHIVLSIGVVRLVLKAIYYALTDNIVAHKSIKRRDHRCDAGFADLGDNSGFVGHKKICALIQPRSRTCEKSFFREVRGARENILVICCSEARDSATHRLLPWTISLPNRKQSRSNTRGNSKARRIFC
jgi:putative membrane protein